jgi:hypothetical protein
MIQDLILRWCKGIALSLHWVIGHTDRIDLPLTRDERLNIEADRQADVIRAQACGMIVAHPNCPHWDIEEASLFIRGSKVTRDMNNQLTSQMHDNNLRYFLMQKESWSTQIFDAIDWNAIKRALRRLSKNRHMNVLKPCHNYSHTGSIHVRFYGGESPCCFCKETKEDWRQILNCPSLNASYHRYASLQKVKKDIQTWRLPTDFWTAIEKGLHHLPGDLKESTRPTSHFPISVDPIMNHLWAPFQEHRSIKWTNLLKGRISHRWHKFATAHVRSKKLNLRAQEWGPKFITALWEHSLRIWKFRNDAFHGDASTQVKSYKLDELEREKTQIRKRYIELQPI